MLNGRPGGSVASKIAHISEMDHDLDHLDHLDRLRIDPIVPVVGCCARTVPYGSHPAKHVHDSYLRQVVSCLIAQIGQIDRSRSIYLSTVQSSTVNRMFVVERAV